MNDNPALELLLTNIQNQLSAVEAKLNNAASLNGGFDKLVVSVDKLQADVDEVKGLLIGDGTKVGVVSRVRELELAQVERQKFLTNVVEPGLKEHQRLVFQMEQFDGLLERDDEQAKELTLLKERVAILNKVMWLLGTGTAGLLLKAVMAMVVTP